MPTVRSVVVVREVVLTRPHQLDRSALDLLRDCGSFDRKLVTPAPAEPAAEPSDVHDDVFGGDAEATGDKTLSARGHLRWRPHLHHAVLEERGAVLRFERGVGEKWIVV